MKEEKKTATDILKHEHKIVLKVLEVVRREAQSIADNDKISMEKLEKIINFYRVTWSC